MAAGQVADFVSAHRHVVREFDFENVFLTNEGTWEEALSPLSETTSSEEWSSQRSGSDADSNSGLESLRSHGGFDYIDIGSDVPLDSPIDVVTPPVVAAKLKKRHRRRKRKHNHKASQLDISSPILDSHPVDTVVLDTLEPTVFDPSVQGVQRDFRLEAAQQELADDPDKRVMMLKRAKEAVLRQLGKSYGKKNPMDLLNTCSSAWKSRGFIGNESNSALVPLMFSRF